MSAVMEELVVGEPNTDRSSTREVTVHVADRVLRVSARLLQVVAVGFAVIPALVVIVFSFSAERFLAFPPREWGLTQYRNFFGSGDWMSAIATSFKVAIPTATLTMLIVTPAAFAIANPRLRGGRALEVASLAPLLLPLSAYAVALYIGYLRLGLIGSFAGLVLAQATIAVPVALLITVASLRRIPRDFEFAAMSLGAPRWRATVGITGRLLAPALCAGFLFSFLSSFDDAVLITFLGAGRINTLSLSILISLRTALDPVVTAISTLLMVFTALVVGGALWLRRGAQT
jgi:ABC-type spermidine/putrescine transport system permease subunit II